MTLPTCNIMHKSTELTGWELVDLWFENTTCIQHVVPHGDLRAHQLDPSCWCKPVEDTDQPDLWAHNSADGRERYENGAALN